MDYREQAYNIFNGDGRLLQVEYGLEAVQSAPPIVTVAGSDAIVCVAKRLALPALCRDTPTAFHEVTDGIFMNITGDPADVSYIINKARTIASALAYDLGGCLTPGVLAHSIADRLQPLIQRTQKRAPAFAAAICGFDGTAPHLSYTDTSAVAFPQYAVACGKDASQMMKYLEKNYRQGSTAEALELAVAALLKSIGSSAEHTEIEAAVVTLEGLSAVPDNELSEVIQAIAERQ